MDDTANDEEPLVSKKSAATRTISEMIERGDHIKPENEPDAEGTVSVRAPMVGVFYHAQAPKADPLIAVGDKVDPETEIGIIEAMKVFLPIPAETRGEVVEIVIPNGRLVNTGTILMRIKPL